MVQTEKMQAVPIKNLVPYANNARTHSEAQIKQLQASIREFGFINPVLIDSSYGIIAGHGRVLAAQTEGLETVPCVFVEHLTEAQKKAYIIADNKLAMNAGWDMDLLKVEIEGLQGFDFNISLLGFDDAELSKLMGDIESVQDDDFDVEAELKKPAITKLALWQLGPHRLVCGDSKG